MTQGETNSNSPVGLAQTKVRHGFIERMEACIRKQLTGWLQVDTGTGQQWKLHFLVGRIVMAEGGIHPVRRLRRHLLRHCRQEDLSNLTFPQFENENLWDAPVLAAFLKHQLISREQAIAAMEGIGVEVLFDILQQGATKSLSYETQPQDPLNILRTELSPLNIASLYHRACQFWKEWAQAGFASVSPNLAPVLKDLERLQQHTSPKSYQNLMAIANGQRTLRDLVGLMKQEQLVLVRLLHPYLSQGLIALEPIPDLTHPFVLPAVPAGTGGTTAAIARPHKATKPLIACVDDSPHVVLRLRKIAESHGYRFVSVGDGVQALSLLLDSQPDLIFLDLVMPVVSGYELCAQIRRIAQFKETPIVILTGNDGVVDRVRARMVGASDFLTKPVDAEKVLAIAQKYLAASPNEPSSAASGSATG